MTYKLSDICTITKGDTGIMKAIPGKYTMITLGEDNKTHNEFQFDAKAVIVPLISSTGHGHASMKRVKYFEGKFALGNILSAVIPKDETKINAKYLHIYLHENREKLLVPLMKGAANVSLPINRLENVEVVIPSMKKQLEIIDIEKSISYKNFQLTNAFENQMQLTSKIRQSILQDAIQGKLTAEWRKQNTKTEPASKLLKRIKIEKEKLIREKKIKKEKQLPPISGKEIPFQLPEGWVWCRLGEIINISSGDGLTANQMIPGKYPVYGGNGITGYHDKFNIEEETVTIGRVGAYCGSVHLTPNNAWITDNCFCVKYNKSNINKYFLIWLLRYMNLREHSFDGAQPVISGKRIYPLMVFLPPLLEQQAIVEKVETLLAKCDLLQKEIENQNNYSKDLLKAVFNETFGG